MLSTLQQRTIQSSIENLTCSTKELSSLFYDRLFERAPDLRALFPDQMMEQEIKLEQTLVYVISMMNDPEGLFSVLDELGIAHENLGARPEHYEEVGHALIGALRQQVAGWNAEYEASWVLLYHVVSTRMQSASQTARHNSSQSLTPP